MGGGRHASGNLAPELQFATDSAAGSVPRVSRGDALRIEEVAGRAAFRRFLELPFRLHAAHPHWRAPLPASERRRLTPRMNPFFGRGDAAYFLARRGSVDVGRVTAHVRHPGDQGWFGFFEVDVEGEADGGSAVATALLERAGRWLAERECTTATGPVSFTEDEELGVLVAGHDHDGLTGRPWTPVAYAVLLSGRGSVAAEVATYVLDLQDAGVADLASAAVPAVAPAAVAVPAGWAPTADPALAVAVEGAGVAVAVPNVAGSIAGAGVRSAWSLAKRARTRDWEGAVVLALDGPADVLVPALAQAATGAGYRWLASPWSPDDRTPSLVHRTFTLPLPV